MIIDKDLLDKVSEQAKTSPRLRMNYKFVRFAVGTESQERATE